MDSHMEHTVYCMIKLFAFTNLFSCSKLWATSCVEPDSICVEPDSICVSDDRPKT